VKQIPRFYVDAPLRAGETCTLAEDSAHHAVHVLRLRAGDEATLFNGRGGEFAARNRYGNRQPVFSRASRNRRKTRVCSADARRSGIQSLQ